MSAESLARSLYNGIADRVQTRRRAGLMLPACSDHDGDPTVYFLTPDYRLPAGGIRVIYRHVDILNAAGLRAFVLHQRAGFRCAWFDHETRITDVGRARLGRRDLLVVSEVDLDLLARLPTGVSYAIFNQNSHLTWRHAAEQSAFLYCVRPGLRGVVTVSDHNAAMLRYAFPHSLVFRVHLGLDPDLFHPGSEVRPQRVTYMPRRSFDDARQVLELLRARNALRGWEVVALQGLTHRQVAEELRSSRIFLAFTHQEGFGLPAAEAMANGNYVIGNHGHGGREFFHPNFSTPVDGGDILGFARAVEAVIENEARLPGWCAERGRMASQFVRTEYNPEREARDVASLYARLIGASGAVTEAAE